MSNLDNKFLHTINFVDEDREKEKEEIRQKEDNSDDELESFNKLSLSDKERKEMEASEMINNRERGKMTGPKGVIADYRYFKKHQNKIDQPTEIKESVAIIDEMDLDLELEDEEFFKLYKQKRVEELKNKNKSTVYGEVYELQLTTFNDALIKPNPQTPVIVHLYERHIEDCNKLHKALDELSKMYTHAKFCEIAAHKTSKNFDDVVLPSLLVYRNNKLEHNLIRFIDEYQTKSITTQNTEEVLVRLGVLSTTDKFLVEE